MYMEILKGAGYGIVTSILGWARKDSKNLESFDLMKMLPTILLSAVIGGFVAYTGQEFGLVYDAAINGGGAILIQNLLKSVWKRF